MKSIDSKLLSQTPDDELTRVFPVKKYGYSRGELRVMKNKLKDSNPTLVDNLRKDRDYEKTKRSYADLKKLYHEAIKTIDELEKDRIVSASLKNTVSTYTIRPSKKHSGSEAVAVWVASDWHTDEIVDGQTINNLNEYNERIARERAENFFVSGLRLTDILAQDVKIETIVLALLGDFFTGHIHSEFMELTDTEPIHAVIRVQNMLASGLEYILKNSNYKLIIQCHSGNHARITEQTRSATENGHSLEFYMYTFLADHFKHEKRIKFNN